MLPSDPMYERGCQTQRVTASGACSFNMPRHVFALTLAGNERRLAAVLDNGIDCVEACDWARFLIGHARHVRLRGCSNCMDSKRDAPQLDDSLPF